MINVYEKLWDCEENRWIVTFVGWIYSRGKFFYDLFLSQFFMTRCYAGNLFATWRVEWFKEDFKKRVLKRLFKVIFKYFYEALLPPINHITLIKRNKNFSKHHKTSSKFSKIKLPENQSANFNSHKKSSILSGSFSNNKKNRNNKSTQLATTAALNNSFLILKEWLKVKFHFLLIDFFLLLLLSFSFVNLYRSYRLGQSSKIDLFKFIYSMLYKINEQISIIRERKE